MSRIREEEARLLKLVSECEGHPFHELFDMPKEGESAFMVKKDTEYIVDYDFETPVELQNMLKSMWREESERKALLMAVPCITAAVFKQEPNGMEGNEQEQGGIEVPMYIYNF